MRWALIIGGVLAGLMLLVVVVGMLRPKGHIASTRATFAHSPEELWATLSDFDHWAEWNPEVKSVERLPDRNGRTMLNVVGSWGAAATELAIWDPPFRLESRMNAGGFRGSWTYHLAPSPDGGTVLTVTERGEVDNPIFRTMMILRDNHATMIGFHRAIAARLGESVAPVKVEPPAG